MDLEIVDPKTEASIVVLHDVTSDSTIADVRRRFGSAANKSVERVAFKAEPRGKLLKDDAKLDSLDTRRLYFKDLGPQISWTTVFLFEYSGPLFIFPLFYLRPALIYGDGAANAPRADVVTTALFCWTFHYLKRDLETLFVHRFSHGTMPIRNLFKNCSYYWGFAAWTAYLINHPLYSAPSTTQSRVALGCFVFCEIGNFFIHTCLAGLRPPGTRVRRVPLPNANPFTKLFKFVSCPNYTYEVGAWISFAVMTQSLVAGLFAVAGFYQMTVWAVGKHRNYVREFKDYPRGRKAILPFLI